MAPAHPDVRRDVRAAEGRLVHPAQPATGHASYIRGQAGNPLFNDSNPNRYFKTDQPTAGVKVAGSGTTIRVLEEQGTSVKIRIDTLGVTP